MIVLLLFDVSQNSSVQLPYRIRNFRKNVRRFGDSVEKGRALVFSSSGALSECFLCNTIFLIVKDFSL